MEGPFKLSILIPTWNRAERLREQIHAILPFLTSEIELLISDNGSGDATPQVVQEAISSNPAATIRYLRNPTNIGADGNIRQALQSGRGQWLWLIGDDDALNFAILPELLPVVTGSKQQVHLLQDSPAGMRSIRSHALSRMEFIAGPDRLGNDLLQLGLVICNRAAVASLPAARWEEFVGLQHAQLLVNAEGLKQGGVLVSEVSLYRRACAGETPRWDLFDGHLGAWRANLVAFPDAEALVSARERRLRQSAIFDALVGRTLLGKRTLSRDWLFCLSSFSLRARLKVCLLLALSLLGPRGRAALLSQLLPGNRAMIRRIRGEPAAAAL
jgi:glycosyltransferase involved in cell wall biosynthesis